MASFKSLYQKRTGHPHHTAPAAASCRYASDTALGLRDRFGGFTSADLALRRFQVERAADRPGR
jgi:hypothetical protein